MRCWSLRASAGALWKMPPGSAWVQSALLSDLDAGLSEPRLAAPWLPPGCADWVSCAVQLLGDTTRGWAWTRALQGLPANEIHLCGDGSAVPLVRKLAAAMGESVEVREYQRFTPVEVGALLSC